MLSIKPKWCGLIASGEKTIEIRKTRPKIQTPFKCYIYCTKPKEHFKVGKTVLNIDDLYRFPDGGIKYGCSVELCVLGHDKNSILNGKVIGEFICDRVFEYEYFAPDFWVGLKEGYAITEGTELIINDCLSQEELIKYGKGNPIYGWHISDLKIYDKPKELGEFYTKCQGNGSDKDKLCRNCPHLCFDHDPIMGYCRWCGVYNSKPVTRPPQSWCYVEVLK